MATVHVALQEGFDNDTVIIRINGQDVFHKSGVKTRLQIGYADSVEVPVQEDRANIEVRLPQKQLVKTTALAVAAKIYVGVSIRGGEIDFHVSAEPFGYL